MTLGEVGWRPNPGKVPLPRPSPASLAGPPLPGRLPPSCSHTTSQSSPAVRGGESSEGGGDLGFLEEAWEQEAERGSERARERGVRGEERGFEE